MQEYKCHNADILLKEDCTVDDLIDVIEVMLLGMQLELVCAQPSCWSASSCIKGY